MVGVIWPTRRPIKASETVDVHIVTSASKLILYYIYILYVVLLPAIVGSTTGCSKGIVNPVHHSSSLIAVMTRQLDISPHTHLLYPREAVSHLGSC